MQVESEDYELLVLELKQLAITLLEAMCEETHEKTAELVKKIHQDIDIEALHKTFAYFCKLSKDPYMVGGLFTIYFEANVCTSHRKRKRKMMMQKEQPLKPTMY